MKRILLYIAATVLTVGTAVADEKSDALLTALAQKVASWGDYRGKVVETLADGWHKYSLGPYAESDEALAALAEARAGGFPGAFIVKKENKP